MLNHFSIIINFALSKQRKNQNVKLMLKYVKNVKFC